MNDLAFRPTGRPPTCTCGECKKCKYNQYMKGYYQSKTPEERRRIFVSGRNPDRLLAHERNRSRTQAKRDSIKRSQLRHPEKHKARATLNDAVRRGKIQRRPCEVCALPKVEAHHDDYSLPLEVRWLCRTHHTMLHPR